MKRPESEALRNKLLKFLTETEKQIKKKARTESNKSQCQREVMQFIEGFEETFQELFNFSEEREYDNGEAIEGIITKSLYSNLIDFYPPEINDKLDMNLFIFGDFLEMRHLECPDAMVIPAQFELAKQ